MVAKITHLLHRLAPLQDPESMKNFIMLFQLTFAGVFLFVIWRISGRGMESGFKFREADRLKNRKRAAGYQQGIKRDPATVLLLEGIRTDVPPHELLGVSEDASIDQIQKAYRRLMMRYHPDRIGSSGSREWKDAQRIAEAINLAKESLVKRKKLQF